MIKSVRIEHAGRNNQIVTIELRKYEWHRLTAASQKRLAAILATQGKEEWFELDPHDLTPTVYMEIGEPKREGFDNLIVGRRSYTLIEGKVETTYTPYDPPIRESELN